jgi:prepilin signal peptidase PulO-like enzyme (type II secretory pathway)
MVEYLFYGFFIFMLIYAIWERIKGKEKPKQKEKRIQVGHCPECGQRLHKYDDDTVVCTNQHFWEI